MSEQKISCRCRDPQRIEVGLIGRACVKARMRVPPVIKIQISAKRGARLHHRFGQQIVGASRLFRVEAFSRARLIAANVGTGAPFRGSARCLNISEPLRRFLECRGINGERCDIKLSESPRAPGARAHGPFQSHRSSRNFPVGRVRAHGERGVAASLRPNRHDLHRRPRNTKLCFVASWLRLHLSLVVEFSRRPGR